jgi:hypothetical protein
MRSSSISKYYSGIRLKRLRITTKSLSQDSNNPAEIRRGHPPEYKSGGFPLRQSAPYIMLRYRKFENNNQKAIYLMSNRSKLVAVKTTTATDAYSELTFSGSSICVAFYIPSLLY